MYRVELLGDQLKGIRLEHRCDLIELSTRVGCVAVLLYP